MCISPGGIGWWGRGMCLTGGGIPMGGSPGGSLGGGRGCWNNGWGNGTGGLCTGGGCCFELLIRFFSNSSTVRICLGIWWIGDSTCWSGVDWVKLLRTSFVRFESECVSIYNSTFNFYLIPNTTTHKRFWRFLQRRQDRGRIEDVAIFIRWCVGPDWILA